MSIIIEEEALFEQWSKKSADHAIFMRDGVIDENSYLNSTPKILFVLKEVNDPDAKEGWDLRDILRTGKRAPTWNNATRWIKGIRNHQEDIPWKDLADINENQRRSELSSIAVMNLKKMPGGHTANGDVIEKFALADAVEIKQQFEIYKPDIVISCGVGYLLRRVLYQDKKIPEWQQTRHGIQYLKYQSSDFTCTIFDCHHPEARCSANLLYYGLIDAVREIHGT